MDMKNKINIMIKLEKIQKNFNKIKKLFKTKN